mmetsp:Transcript_103417/g.299179  ORF Transcript_103417/g.299179 Transcript_103417/m.299179 type:complete len:301 (-) Transcript_103417:85-987(-)
MEAWVIQLLAAEEVAATRVDVKMLHRRWAHGRNPSAVGFSNHHGYVTCNVAAAAAAAAAAATSAAGCAVVGATVRDSRGRADDHRNVDGATCSQRSLAHGDLPDDGAELDDQAAGVLAIAFLKLEVEAVNVRASWLQMENAPPDAARDLVAQLRPTVDGKPQGVRGRAARRCGGRLDAERVPEAAFQFEFLPEGRVILVGVLMFAHLDECARSIPSHGRVHATLGIDAPTVRPSREGVIRDELVAVAAFRHGLDQVLLLRGDAEIPSRRSARPKQSRTDGRTNEDAGHRCSIAPDVWPHP